MPSYSSLGASVLALLVGGCGSPGLTLDAGVDASRPADLAVDPNAIVLTMDTFVIPPGSEAYHCQNFKNPVGGDLEIQAFESHMAPGSHHLLVFYKSGLTDGALETCSGLEFDATPYGSQRPDESVTYPAGIAALLTKDQGLRLQSHYLNPTNAPITAEVKVILHPAAAGTVTAHAGVFFFLNKNLAIPSQPAPTTVTKTCRIPVDLNVIQASSHMHQHGTHFEAQTEGSTIYNTDEWSEPPSTAYSPPLQFHAGKTVTFSCTFLNQTGVPLTFGESARTDEMCIFSGQVYPIIGNINLLPCL